MTSPKQTEPKRRGGRKPRDWEGIFRDWVASKVPLKAFLEGRGLNPRAGAVYQATRHWQTRVARLAADADGTNTAQLGGERISEVGKAPVMPERSSEVPTGRDALEVAQNATPAAWQVLQGWRRKQAVEDWKGADQARVAIKLILRDSVKQAVDGDGKVVFTSVLRAHEVRQLTQALADIQRIQRLALGLSTENVGVDQPVVGDTNVEKNVTPSEEPIPTFQVEMSARGKFLRPRPRRVK